EAIIHHSCSGRFAVRRGKWVLIDWPTGDDNGEPGWLKERRGYKAHSLPGELYDLSADLMERENLYAENPGLVKELQSLLYRYRSAGRSVIIQ
ncbi:MAG: arylsulfatase, partial [Spirochaetales bacterium]|nr:arylsulfatase [Spirochaetales bacterium]